MFKGHASHGATLKKLAALTHPGPTSRTKKKKKISTYRQNTENIHVCLQVSMQA
jgi:hypothetical protein